MSLRLDYDTGALAYPEVPLPRVWTVRQKRAAPVLGDVEGAAREAAAALCVDPRIRPGASVAVGVGSRGISNLVAIVRATIDELKRRGCEPFIVPAMGSHGGATAEGQEAVLRDYGMTLEAVGAPICATMEVDQVSALEDGYPVYFDRYARAADAVVVISRVKEHTDFTGPLESGPGKMLAIGLGKQKGAATIHRFGAEGLRDTIPQVARRLVECANVVGAVAIVENPYGGTAEIYAVPADQVAGEGEKRLLARARELMPRLPFAQMDVLVVDLMGKDISGTGMDTRVIGRLNMPSVPRSDWGGPDIRVVCTLDITDGSHGNAAGLGLADVVTRRLIERVDFRATWTNFRTSGEGAAWRARIPIIQDDAPAAVRTAIGVCGRGHLQAVRLVRIRDTEHVDCLEVSEALLAESRNRSDLEVSADPHALEPGTALAT